MNIHMEGEILKTCVLCPEQIRSHHRLCSSCYKQYSSQITEQWFLELEKMQVKQDRINDKESFTLFTGLADSYGKPYYQAVSVGNVVGRPPTGWILANEVLEHYDRSIDRERLGKGKRLSLRKLESVMNHRVKFLVIRRILLTYRSDTFPNKPV